MLLYAFKLQEEITNLVEQAQRLQSSYDSKDAPTLLQDTKALQFLWDALKTKLPAEVLSNSQYVERRFGWLNKRLSEGLPGACRTDIDDLCDTDLPQIVQNFRAWCKSADHFDQQLAKQTITLVETKQYDSAIRKAFVLLTERLTSSFSVSVGHDGEDLVNRISGNSGVASNLPNDERQRQRNLLAGLYGVYRNKYSHGNTTAPWHETDAVLSMINSVLKGLPDLVARGLP